MDMIDPTYDSETAPLLRYGAEIAVALVLLGEGYQSLQADGDEDSYKEITMEWIEAELEEIKPALAEFVCSDSLGYF